METEGRDAVLPYRGALGSAADGRRWFSLRAAVAVAAVLLTAGALLLWFVPTAHSVSTGLGANPTPAADWLVQAGQTARGWRPWAAGATAIVVLAVVAGVRRRRVEPEADLRAARWRLAFATTLSCFGVAIVTAALMVRPLLRLHRDVTRPVAVRGDVRTFATASALYRYIAVEQLGQNVTADEVLRVAAGASVEYRPWPGGRLWVVAPTDYVDPTIPWSLSYFRGAQGNGSYYLVVQRADGALDLVCEAGGNHYEIDGEGPGATLSTSWHMGAAERVHTEYRFDGRRFVAKSRRTETVGDE